MSLTLSNEAERITLISTEGPALARRINEMLVETDFGDLVRHTSRAPMFAMPGRPKVHEWTPDPRRPVSAWSSGEQALWLFLASLTGAQASVNFYGLAMQFAGTPEARHIADLVTLMMDGD